MLKKLNMWWHRKLVMKVTFGDKITSNLNTIIAIGYAHSFSLTLLLGSRRIDFATTILLVLSDFGLNTWCLLVKILRSGQRSTTMTVYQQSNSLKCLALKEFMEILVPLVFCFSFAIAYNGPIAELIGNVKGNCWMFKEEDNLIEKLSRIALFIFIDLIRALSFGFILWHFCQLNMYSAYCYVVKNYGLLITFFGSIVINGVTTCNFIQIQ